MGVIETYSISGYCFFGLEGDNGFPGITFGRRHYKTGLKEWNSYNYIDAQIAFVTIGIGVGLLYNASEIFYKYKLFAGYFGLGTYDYINGGEEFTINQSEVKSTISSLYNEFLFNQKWLSL